MKAIRTSSVTIVTNHFLLKQLLKITLKLFMMTSNNGQSNHLPEDEETDEFVEIKVNSLTIILQEHQAEKPGFFFL